MAQTRLVLEGMEQTLRAMRRAPDVFRKHISVGVGVSTLRLANAARNKAPVATGNLKNNIDADHADGTLTGNVGIRDQSEAFYWYFIEFGTVNLTARPFFRPAMEEEQARFIREVSDAGVSAEHELDT